MSRVRRAYYAALLCLALVAGGLVVTVGGAWPDMQSVLGVVMMVCSALLVLKALSVFGVVGLGSLL
jgi:hypothetical protein